ncbi:uncharacterized protein KY384_005965 [Bacidia gigantensis]|uniref:uncharacterized protein n=1 Tax=Bacidia gigantensis TaxID=2732470 RepID=UPI001D0454C5|nr:uncharacterized protein KY384_005965 [Bacidia gigantensis]KAG8529329.1 hypothetical protein KY384_005965 [Bacidia gigantensis]
MGLQTCRQELVRLLSFAIVLSARLVLAGPSINVALQASFASPPYLLELLETAAEENPTSYFPLLDRIAEGRFIDCNTDQELYDNFLHVLREEGHIDTEEGIASFQFALSIHSAAPRIQAHYQYYETSIEPSLMVAQDAACPIWVHFNGKQYCSPALDKAQQDAGQIKNLAGLPFDRILDAPVDSEAVPSVLYADITSPLFGQFHHTISATARNGETSYRIRYRPQGSQERKPLPINGYGVELMLKRTDYIVIDDREAAKEGEDEADFSEETASDWEAPPILDTIDEEITDLKPLAAKELSGLGLKTTSFIMASEDPFETLNKISRDFPKFSMPLSKRNVSKEVLAEHRVNREKFLPAGYNVIWMNGQQIQSREMDAYALLQQLRRERQIVGNLQKLGFTGAESVKILSSSAISESKVEEDSQRYNYRDDIEGGGVIIWLNDIERDQRYSSWPPEASAILQRTWPGQLPQVRRDIHNVVIPMDLTDDQDLEIIVEQLQMAVKRKFPIRFGIVPLLTTANAIDQAKVVYHIWDSYGLSALFSYLELSRKSKGPAVLRGNFESSVKDRKLRHGRLAADFQEVLQGDSENMQALDESSGESLSATANAISLDLVRRYFKRLGIVSQPAPFFSNGVAMPRNDNWLSAMTSRVDADLRMLQRQVYEGQIPEDSWLAGQLIENAPAYRNALIVPEDEASIKFVDIGSLTDAQKDLYDTLPHVPSVPEAVGMERFAPELTIIANFDSEDGVKLLLEGAKFQREQPEVEVRLLHNPTSTKLAARSIMIAELARRNHGRLERGALESALHAERPASEHSQRTIEEAESTWQGCQLLIRAFSLTPGEHSLILNGRKVGPLPPAAVFSLEDFSFLLQYERQKRLLPAEKALTTLGLHDRLKSASDSAVLTSTIALSAISDIPEGIFDSSPTVRMDRFRDWSDTYTMITTGNVETSSIHLVASIDPTSQVAQRWIPILKVLSELSGVHVKLFLNPREKMQELPVKRFYRHILESKPTFTQSGGVSAPGAIFRGVPEEALLNLALDVPPAWLVTAKQSIHDLDNIKLSALKKGEDVDALYELEYILIEGHSRDVSVGTPPRGVQLFLGTERNPHFADTIIMANLGYFQFKVNPGYWTLKLQSGRSSQIFAIDSAGQEGWYPAPGDHSTDITLMSFQGKTLYPRLSRRPGQENEDVLEEGGLSILKTGAAAPYIQKASKLASSFLSKTGLIPSGPQHADINIFSVASGHLYERMLSIMIVSVMRHTNRTVKFWFIAQFLSPSFKESLPTLASHYHFDYELITYKWPHWLRAQPEKQRQIWGYKILFLDVLFPTSLEKVIFVDADQIVRTDMYDLVTLDLEGAPYGFTPMCDSRTSMEGYRFWKTGYWANFLRGLPYHISALYVVDLVKFREIAAGDRLRGQYHQLSADPASLSNLDQDLPNHMQHVLQIKSLPQEWLWCETWCADEGLEKARTIDLCNNPETKEPKLKRARRQVPEWNVYDEEIAGVLRAAEGKGGVRGGVQEVMIEGTVEGKKVLESSDPEGKKNEAEKGDVPEGKKIKDEL